jgi:hypothetical protein
MTTKKSTKATELRLCAGSKTFGIEPHEAPIADFPVQPSRKDGLGVMCKTHWTEYTRALRQAQRARQATGDTPAKAPRARKATEPKPEPERVRKARAKLAEVDTLGGTAYTDAVGSDEVQAAIETVNGHGTDPDDGQVLVAGVLYDAETLEETPLGETTDGGTEEADAA